jgi:hypothetical protein
LLRKKFFADALELFFDPLDLLACALALLTIQFHCLRAGQPPMGTVHNHAHHLQVVEQFGACSGQSFLLPLRFEKQRRVIQNAFTDRDRSSAPGGIQLTSFARIAVMFGKDRRHALAVFQALSRHRHQKLHRHLRRNLAFAHLLLDEFRQQFR